MDSADRNAARDDFALFLNGDKVPPSKLTAKKIGALDFGQGTSRKSLSLHLMI